MTTMRSGRRARDIGDGDHRRVAWATRGAPRVTVTQRCVDEQRSALVLRYAHVAHFRIRAPGYEPRGRGSSPARRAS